MIESTCTCVLKTSDNFSTVFIHSCDISLVNMKRPIKNWTSNSCLPSLITIYIYIYIYMESECVCVRVWGGVSKNLMSFVIYRVIPKTLYHFVIQFSILNQIISNFNSTRRNNRKSCSMLKFFFFANEWHFYISMCNVSCSFFFQVYKYHSLGEKKRRLNTKHRIRSYFYTRR